MLLMRKPGFHCMLAVSGSNTPINTKFDFSYHHFSLLGAQLSSSSAVLSPCPHGPWNHLSKLGRVVIAPCNRIPKLGNYKTPTRTFWWCLSYWGL